MSQVNHPARPPSRPLLGRAPRAVAVVMCLPQEKSDTLSEGSDDALVDFAEQGSGDLMRFLLALSLTAVLLPGAARGICLLAGLRDPRCSFPNGSEPQPISASS